MNQSHPFNIIISGGRGQGKTNLMLNIVLNEKVNGERFDSKDIYLITPTADINNQYLVLDIGRRNIFNRLDDFDKIIDEVIGRAGDKKLVIMDDILGSTTKKSGVSYYQTRLNTLFANSRHLGISCILVLHKITAVPDSLVDNSDGIFVFYTANQRERAHMYDLMGGNMSRSEFMQLLNALWKEGNKHDFIYLDKHYKRDGSIIHHRFRPLTIKKREDFEEDNIADD